MEQPPSSLRRRREEEEPARAEGRRLPALPCCRRGAGASHTPLLLVHLAGSTDQEQPRRWTLPETWAGRLVLHRASRCQVPEQGLASRCGEGPCVCWGGVWEGVAVAVEQQVG